MDDLEPTVRRLFDAFDRLDLDASRALMTDDIQGVDEIARTWMRGLGRLTDYFDQLSAAVSDIRSELSDIHETVHGDVGLFTCWLEQDYAFEGTPTHVSAPTTILLRRSPDQDWKVALVHSVPLPQDTE